MNRRELFKGLAAALVVVSIPFPVEAIEALSDTQAIAYLKRVREDLIAKIIYPPCTMDDFNKITVMDTKPWDEALAVVNNLIEELSV